MAKFLLQANFMQKAAYKCFIFLFPGKVPSFPKLSNVLIMCLPSPKPLIHSKTVFKDGPQCGIIIIPDYGCKMLFII